MTEPIPGWALSAAAWVLGLLATAIGAVSLVVLNRGLDRIRAIEKSITDKDEKLRDRTDSVDKRSRHVDDTLDQGIKPRLVSIERELFENLRPRLHKLGNVTQGMLTLVLLVCQRLQINTADLEKKLDGKD